MKSDEIFVKCDNASVEKDGGFLENVGVSVLSGFVVTDEGFVKSGVVLVVVDGGVKSVDGFLDTEDGFDRIDDSFLETVVESASLKSIKVAKSSLQN